MAARITVAVENPADVCVISAPPYSQRGILEFAAHTGANAIAGLFTPGNFINQLQPLKIATLLVAVVLYVYIYFFP